MKRAGDYPNATSPLPAGSGFKKVADAAALVRGMGLRVGKTFNSQQGGATSDQVTRGLSCTADARLLLPCSCAPETFMYGAFGSRDVCAGTFVRRG